ncbi:MAG: hypothetical protein R3F48_06805 [Candidatus Zixiibacteriota bacterium]
MNLSFYRRVMAWIKSTKLRIAESGSRLSKKHLVEEAIKIGRQKLAEARELIDEARERLASEIESISEFIERVDIVPKLYLRYSKTARHILWFIVAAFGLEALISAILGKAWFPTLDGNLAILCAIGVSGILSIACHGFFIGMFSSTERLRAMRLLRYNMILFGIISLVLFICPVLSRVIIIPYYLTSICLGAIGITIPLSIGAASGYRSILLDVYARPLKELRNYSWAAQNLESQIAEWETDLVKMRDLEMLEKSDKSLVA